MADSVGGALSGRVRYDQRFARSPASLFGASTLVMYPLSADALAVLARECGPSTLIERVVVSPLRPERSTSVFTGWCLAREHGPLLLDGRGQHRLVWEVYLTCRNSALVLVEHCENVERPGAAPHAEYVGTFATVVELSRWCDTRERTREPMVRGLGLTLLEARVRYLLNAMGLMVASP